MRFLKRDKPTTTAVARIDPAQLASQANDPTGLVRVFYELAANPEMPVEKMEQVVALHERMFRQQAELEYNRAMNRVQSRIEPVVKTAWNKQTKSWYAKLDQVAQAVHPIAIEEGFSYSFSEDECPVPDHVRVVMVVRHKAGHTERHHRDFRVDDEGMRGEKNKTRTHGEASAGSYGRRYLTVDVFAVTMVNPETDDDGNAAGGGKPRRKDTITEAQATILTKLIEDTGTTLGSFLAYHQIEKLEDLSERAFAESKDLLETRKRKIEERRRAS